MAGTQSLTRPYTQWPKTALRVGFGGPYTSGSSDVGTAVIYAVVFAGLLLFAFYQGPSRLSVDYYLEQKISWWHWIAEVGHHERYRTQPATTPTAIPPTAPSQHATA